MKKEAKSDGGRARMGIGGELMSLPQHYPGNVHQIMSLLELLSLNIFRKLPEELFMGTLLSDN